MVSACASIWVGGSDGVIGWFLRVRYTNCTRVAITLEHLSQVAVFPRQSGGVADLPGSGPQAFDDD